MLSVAESEQLYEAFSLPTARLHRWTLRRRHGLSDHALKGLLHGLVAAVETLADTSIPGIEVFIREESTGVPAEAEITDDGLDVLLESLRRARSDLEGPTTVRVLLSTKARFPAIASECEDAIDRALARLKEIEAFLVLLGAGSDDDGHLGQHLIPAPSKEAPGPSVQFDF